MRGELHGLQLTGTFESWSSGKDERYSEEAGGLSDSSYRLGKDRYEVNNSGDVHRLSGVLLEQAVTQQFIDSDDFARRPQYDRLLGEVTLPGDRAAYAIGVKPPGGSSGTIFLDASTWMLDRVAFPSDAGVETNDFSRYRLVDGVLVPLVRVDSNGDPRFDITAVVTDVRVDAPIAPSVFALPPSSIVSCKCPVTVPLQASFGHYYVTVRIDGRPLRFLIDTGSQSIVLDAHVAKEIGLKPQGDMEVIGARRVGGMQIAPLASIDVGGAAVPVHSVAVIPLHQVQTVVPIDGILGFPFFAAAEVRLDPDSGTMTIGKPGSLPVLGAAFTADADRGLIETNASIAGAPGTFLIDTGDNNSLLVFSNFVQQHQWIFPVQGRSPRTSIGIGGTIFAFEERVDSLSFGPYHFFYQPAEVIEGNAGAFNGRFDDGNIGTGILKNFVLTFDIANDRFYAAADAEFDDGRSG